MISDPAINDSVPPTLGKIAIDLAKGVYPLLILRQSSALIFALRSALTGMVALDEMGLGSAGQSCLRYDV